MRTRILSLAVITVLGGLYPAISMAAVPAPEFSGIAVVRYSGGTSNGNSILTHVNFPETCENAQVVSQTYVSAGLCSVTPVCPNTHHSTSTDIRSSVVNVTTSGFDILATADDAIVAQNISIGWHALCGPNNVIRPVSNRLVSGTITTRYDGSHQTHSKNVAVTLPAGCGANPSVVAETHTDSVACNLSYTGSCYNNAGTTSTDLYPQISGISGNGFSMSVTSDDIIPVGAGGNIKMSYHVMCANAVTQAKSKFMFGGVAEVTYNNASHSSITQITFPKTCKNPTAIAQSYVDSLKCVLYSGACYNNRGTTSTDIYAYAINVTETGMGVFLSSDDIVAGGGQKMNIAYHVTCEEDAPVPQCRDGIDNDGDGKVDFPSDPGCTNADDNDETDLSCPNQQQFEYTMTSSSTFFYNQSGQSSGSVTSCTGTQPAGNNWTFVDSECLVSGNGCYAQTCLWKRPANTGHAYLITHAGGMYYNSLSCASNPPAGYTLKSRGCIANNSLAPYNCFSDECLWEKDAPSTDNLLLSHAGSNGAAVDCRNSVPATGYSLNSQICLLSNGPCFSDLCLWKQARSCQATPQCSDGVDNDGDGLVDYPQDPGCSNPDDNDETNNPQCSDGVDNADAEDTLADFNDPGCYTNGTYNPNDNDETNTPTPQCRDGQDNDGDGLVDMQDPGCSNPDDNDETNQPQCSDGIDNSDPEDALADYLDPGCYTNGTYNPNDNDETNQTLPQCRDGQDNDGDGLIDYPLDPGCTNPDDNTEQNQPQCSDGVDNADAEDTLADYNDPGCYTNGTYNPNDNDEGNGPLPQCRDGQDNDGDGLIDYPLDPGCTNPDDNTEQNNPQCSDGVDNSDPEDSLADANDPGCYTNGTYNPNDNDETDQAQLGCIDIVKETFDPWGNPLAITAQFTFTLDGVRTTVNASNGRAKFTGVPAGVHTITETIPSGWRQLLVTPVNGTVNVPGGASCAGVVFKNQQYFGNAGTSSSRASSAASTCNSWWGCGSGGWGAANQQSSAQTSSAMSSQGNVGGWW